jgi:Leucine-rich repeat (LRR) protein
VPGLTVLDCGVNQLTELDLTPVPGLTTLDCSVNQLTGAGSDAGAGADLSSTARTTNSPSWI